MNHNPLVSIVLPVFNGEKHLDRAIQSVLSQTYNNWELIIVNDCSVDKSLQIASGFTQKDKRIKLIDHEVNKKLPAALNTGFKHAQGGLFTWTSHDNEYLPDAILEMVDFMQKNPKAGLLYADEEVVNETSGNVEILAKGNIEKIVFGNVIGACFLYRSEVKDLVGNYNETFFLAEDYDYWLRIWKNFECLHLNKTLHRYFLCDDSLTSTQKPGIVNATLKVAWKNLLASENERLSNEKEILLSWFKYWYKYSLKKGHCNIRIMLRLVSRLLFKYPVFFTSSLLGKRPKSK